MTARERIEQKAKDLAFLTVEDVAEYFDVRPKVICRLIELGTAVPTHRPTHSDRLEGGLDLGLGGGV